MSTIIKPAYKLAAGTEVFAFVREMRNVLTPTLKQYVCNAYYREAVFAFDEDKEGRTFREVLSSLIGEFMKQDSIYASPFNAEVVFLKNPVRGELYVILYNFPDEAVTLFQSLGGVTEDFSYWNNSDSQLEYLSQETWDDRILAWTETLDLFEPTGVQGLTAALFPAYAKKLLSVKDFEKQGDVLDVPVYTQRYDRLLLNVYLSLLSANGIFLLEDGMAAIIHYLTATNKQSALPFAGDYPEFVSTALVEAAVILQQKEKIFL